MEKHILDRVIFVAWNEGVSIVHHVPKIKNSILSTPKRDIEETGVLIVMAVAVGPVLPANICIAHNRGSSRLEWASTLIQRTLDSESLDGV